MEKLMELLTEICPGVDFENETALVDDAVIESLDIITITTEIMDAFDVEITVDDLIPENFNSAKAMWELIERLQS